MPVRINEAVDIDGVAGDGSAQVPLPWWILVDLGLGPSVNVAVTALLAVHAFGLLLGFAFLYRATRVMPRHFASGASEDAKRK